MPTQFSKRFENEVVVNRPAFACKWPGYFQAVGRGRFKRQCIGEVGKGHQAFELVVSIGAPAEHAKSEVDFGKCPLGQWRAHAKSLSLRIN
jgi:hypothetical protein